MMNSSTKHIFKLNIKIEEAVEYYEAKTFINSAIDIKYIFDLC